MGSSRAEDGLARHEPFLPLLAMPVAAQSSSWFQAPVKSAERSEYSLWLPASRSDASEEQEEADDLRRERDSDCGTGKGWSDDVAAQAETVDTASDVSSSIEVA